MNSDPFWLNVVALATITGFFSWLHGLWCGWSWAPEEERRKASAAGVGWYEWDEDFEEYLFVYGHRKPEEDA